MKNPPRPINVSMLLRMAAILAALFLVGCGASTNTPASTPTTEAKQPAPTVPAIAQATSPMATSTSTVAVSPTQPADLTGTATPLLRVDNASTPGTAVAAPGGIARTGRETYTNPGDGTGGSGMIGERSSNLPETPTSAASSVASPVAMPVAELHVVDCELPDVPKFRGEVTRYVLTGDLNFRNGPGSDCELILDTPIGEGEIVRLVGGPVIQDQDDSEWVQIEYDGNTGWVVSEFLEPAP